MRTGILGGTFDPIHVAHLHTAECALHQLSLDRVVVVPAGDPWQKSGREVTPGAHRLEMCRLALADGEGIEIDRSELDREGPTFTIDSLSAFPDEDDLYFIVGSDSLSGFETWHRWEEILERVTLVEAPRSVVDPVEESRYGSVRLDMGLLEISSTDIRRRVAGGLPYRYLVTEPVFEYIESTNLYLQNV